MKIKITDLENMLQEKIKSNTQSIGLDIAERTGICFITTDDTYAELDWQFIEFDRTNINSVYKNMYKEFSKIIVKEKNKDNIVIIEDTFLQRFGKFIQADVFKKLTRFGTLALAVCFDKEVDYKFILAKSARAKLEIEMITGQPKASVANYLYKKLNIKLDDNDISDAIILAMLGLCVNINLDPIPKKKKIKMVQYMNSTGNYVKINKTTKEIIDIKKSNGAYKGIDIIDHP